MSNDFFKVKKGLNIKPQDPSGLSDLQDGDIIVDSTDDNRLKVYDSVGGDFASVGTGGSSGNILSEIEKLTPVTSNVVAAQETTTFLPIDDNNKSVKATFSGSDGSIRYEAAASADLDGVQGVVIVWIKTSLDNLTLTATKDGVAQNNGLTINATNKWRQYKIPVVLGDADYGFQITASGAVAGDVFIDEAFVKVEKQETQLGQAQQWGTGYIADADCEYAFTSTSYALSSADVDCVLNKEGNISQISGNTAGIVINNARTDGYYQVSATGLFITQNATETCQFQLSDNGTNFSIDQSQLQLSESDTRIGYEVKGVFKFSSSGDKTIDMIGQRTNGSQCTFRGRDTQPIRWTVNFFPDADSTIVTQDTELTAQTANEFSAVIDSDGTVISQNYDFIDSCSNSNNCTFKDNIFTVNPSVTCTTVNDSGSDADNCEINSISTTNVTFNTVAANPGTLTNQNVRKYITVSKQGADVNKNATIVGKFEQINDTPLCQVEARGVVSPQAITAGVTNISFQEVSDNCNAYDGTTFTAPRDAFYTFIGNTYYNASGSCKHNVHVNGVFTDNAGVKGVTSDVFKIAFTLKLNQGDAVTIRTNCGAVSTVDDVGNHNLAITELPDNSALVANLSNNPRAARQDQYSETEIEWGRWNGEQLYRRCFTVGSDITSSSTIVTWDSGLKPVGLTNYNGTFFIIDGYSASGTNSSFYVIRYEVATGEVSVSLNTYQLSAGDTHCMDYTK